MDRFRTRRGHCEIEDGTLKIEASLRGTLEGYGRKGIAVGVVAGFLALAVVYVDSGSLATTAYAALGGIGAVALGVAVNYFRTAFLDENEIPLHEIDYVRAKKGRPLVSAPRFIVRYSGSTAGGTSAWRRRYVVLPSLLLADGDEIFDEGIDAFRSNGVRVAVGDENPEDETMQWEEEVDFSMGNRMAEQREGGGGPRGGGRGDDDE